MFNRRKSAIYKRNGTYDICTDLMMIQQMCLKITNLYYSLGQGQIGKSISHTEKIRDNNKCNEN